jgi:L-amino acid N-acyltransferase YncA
VIRRACDADAAAIATIYNQAMAADTFATCDVVAVTPESRIGWLARHRDPFPAFVFDGDEGRVLGWASLNRFSVRESYPSIAEVSVYVHEAHRSRMVGAALFVQLITEATRFGFRSLVSLTFERNRPSLRGLEAAGFRRVGVLSEVAWLRGRWESVVWLQKDLAGDWTLGLDPRLRARLAKTYRSGLIA